MAPSAISKAVLQKISADVQAIVRSPAFAARIKHLDLEPVASTPEEFNEFARIEIVKLGGGDQVVGNAAWIYP